MKPCKRGSNFRVIAWTYWAILILIGLKHWGVCRLKLSINDLKKKYLERKDCFSITFNTLEDLDKLPFVLKKDDMRVNYPDGLCFVDKKLIYQYHETFGTTGTPSANWMTKNDFNAYVDQILLSPVNFSENDFYLNRFPYAISTPAHLFQEAVHRRGGAVIPCSSRTLISPVSRVVKMIFSLQPTIMGCLPDEALQLGYARKSLDIIQRTQI